MPIGTEEEEAVEAAAVGGRKEVVVVELSLSSSSSSKRFANRDCLLNTLLVSLLLLLGAVIGTGAGGTGGGTAGAAAAGRLTLIATGFACISCGMIALLRAPLSLNKASSLLGLDSRPEKESDLVEVLAFAEYPPPPPISPKRSLKELFSYQL